MGFPLSRSFAIGRSETFTVYMFPRSVNRQILPVFLQGTRYRFASSAASLFLS